MTREAARHAGPQTFMSEPVAAGENRHLGHGCHWIPGQAGDDDVGWGGDGAPASGTDAGR